ncbi:hybrid sensor histidine kinase/response regulator transcription factor [Saccharicrinis sp. GN24d3]|uniref:hybrid sensor histidine kinase/response regulator transcription factor n=1 Tax=Saccharicrinis sp. GN24d3 TaxID=3458416 RepID=UPI0040373104
MYKSLLIALFFVFANLFLSAQTYYFEKKSPESGFAFDGITSIAEDQNSLIWFGSSNGLYNYNSHKFYHYRSIEGNTNTLPDNNIQKVYLDNNNHLWICTDNGLCTFNRETNDFTRIKLNPSVVRGKNHYVNNILQANDSVYLCIINHRFYKYNKFNKQLNIHFFYDEQKDVQCRTFTKDDNGNIWIGLGGGHIFKTDSTLKSIDQWKSFRKSPISSICINNHDIWIGYTNQGIDKVGVDGSFIQHYSESQPAPFNLSNNNIRKIESRDNGDIWVATYKGIHILNEKQNHYVVENEFNNLPHNSILDLLKDKNNGMWVATWAGGLAHYSEYNYSFRHIKKIPYHSDITRNIISSIIEDQSGIIYLGSENDGLKTYDSKTETVNSIKLYNNHGELINIKSLAIDKKGRIWLGTFNSGLWYKNPNEKNFKKDEKVFASKAPIIHKIEPFNDGIWICSNGQGATFYNPQNKAVNNFKRIPTDDSGLLTNNIKSALTDHKGNVWFATIQGICVKKTDSDAIKNLGEDDESFRNVIHSLCETDQGEIWAGTNNKGILILDTLTNTFKKLPKKWNDELYEVFSIISDRTGNIWIASNLGIQMYNPRTEKILNFNENDGVLGKNFSPNASLCSKQGTLFFGGYNGFNVIDPDYINLNPHAPDVMLSEIFINNQPFYESSIKQLKDKNINVIKELKLPSHANTLSFSFVANNFIKSYKNNFKYRLVNYQDDWIDLKTKSEISFTKIPPGRYTLEILGSNNNGIWSVYPLSLPIYIKAPFWLTWYAFVIYFILILVIGYIVTKQSYYRINMEKELLMERLKHESDEKLFKEKQKFFTNISHELRTPLTLILSPINLLIQKFKYDNSTQEHLITVKRNADRLLRLTNEFLDFRLIETGKIKYNPDKFDIIEICKNVYSCFTFEASERDINFIFSSRFESLEMNIDNNKMEKIVFNLLSNAFKYSDDKSNILLTIESSNKTNKDYENLYYTGESFEGETLEIKVKNYGNPIPDDQLPKIFERFSMHDSVQSSATGLGLHICKEFIQLHKGNISVTSSKSEGTNFTISLPFNSDSVPAEYTHVIQKEAKDFLTYQPSEEDSNQQKLQSDIVILIVEDNVDLKKYLKKTLERRYKVLTASNGLQGYEIAQEIIPDLIVSDVKMPVLDGSSMTKKLKENSKTRLIPIILLTAMADKSDQIKGIKHGADSYLIKPVEIDLLFARIQNLLDTRKEISNQIREEGKAERPSSTIKKKYTFIEKVEILVLENLLNPQFSVGTLAEDLDISRSSLHRKVKQDSGLSITEFIRDIRMKKTIELMKENKYNLEEIGTYVGFNSHSYFARTFKKKYGKTPTEFYHDIKVNKGTEQ